MRYIHITFKYISFISMIFIINIIRVDFLTCKIESEVKSEKPKNNLLSEQASIGCYPGKCKMAM